ncbi:ABC transporter ATP-binding protein [Actinacidiphila reveromycinica]|nr:ABC transporter ATP-binding protein [Streptomyces sp. SN-593]
MDTLSQGLARRPEPGAAVRTAVRRFWPLTAGDRVWMLVVCCLSLLTALGETAAILLFGELTDGALREGDLDGFWTPAVQWLAVAVVTALLGYLGNSLAALLAERFVLRLRAAVFRHLQTLPPHYFQRHRHGDLVERLTGDVEAVEQMAVSGVLQGVSALLGALLYAAAALWLRWDLALATFLTAPLFLYAAKVLSGRMSAVSRQERRADGALTSVVAEALDNMPFTQAYNRERAEAQRLEGAARAWLRAAVRGARLDEGYRQSIEVVETLCVLGIIGLGAWEISAGRMSLGQLLAFAAFVGYLYPPIRSLGGLALTATAASAGAERLFDILDARPAVRDPEVPAARADPAGPPGAVDADGTDSPPGVVGADGTARTVVAAGPGAGKALGTGEPKSPGGRGPAAAPRLPARSGGGRLELRGVRFGYPGAGRSVLRDVSFTAAPGEVVVVTGPSGAGKSTLLALLTRFYDPDAGSILLDGTDLRDLPLDRLREHVTLLPQRAHVLSGSIRENIACGRPGATDAEIERAARAAGAHAFVRALDDGYFTPLAPRSTGLSGGQLQRIAIARALLRDSPVLVLDEPTTGLDASAVHHLLPALRRLSAGRTTVVVSHDMSVAALADRVLVLEAGHLAASGTHAQLLARGGLYASLQPGTAAG